MKNIITFIVIQFTLLACNTQAELIKPEIEAAMFPGFNFTDKSMLGATLTDYEYQGINGNSVVMANCQQALSTSESTIADFDYHRFKLLIISCKAYEKFINAKPSKQSFMPSLSGHQWVIRLPAEVLPLLSKQDLKLKQEKTLESYYKSKASFQPEGATTTKILSKEDENFISLLARGDFTGDGIEDILVLSEWYARNAHGKHADLLVLSKTDSTSAISIAWRLKKL